MTQTEPNNTYRQELRGQILAAATRLFLQQGVRHVKMDDIANELSISKRTLYEVYSNKASLLFEVVVTRETAEEEHMSQFVMQHPDTIDIIIEFYRANTVELQEINPIFFEDVHKYPHITSYLRQKQEARNQNTISFIQQAVRDGYFREDVNYDIFKNIGMAASQHFMKAKLYKQYPLGELFRTLLMVLLRGICTEKGIKAIDEHLAKIAIE